MYPDEISWNIPSATIFFFSPGWKAEHPEVAGWQAGLLPGPFFFWGGGGMMVVLLVLREWMGMDGLLGLFIASGSFPKIPYVQWIGLRENLQENPYV